MNELQAISNLPENKDEVKRYSEAVIKEVQDGNLNPIELMARLKPIIDTFEKIRKGITENVIRQLELSGGTDRGLEIMESGIKYDYSADPIVTELEAKLKERKEFLKNLPVTGMTELNEETGEVIKIYRPIKKSTTTFKITY